MRMTPIKWAAAAGVAAAVPAIVPAIVRARRAAPAGTQEKSRVDEHLAKFDDLDFNVFSHQDWDGFRKSHAEDILVHWPDGHTTHGLARHIEDMKYMFTYAPDTRIEVHPVKVGQGEWTAVYGVMVGTFSRPMTTPDGRTIQPTGKSFKLPMATFGRWRNGTMVEEYLFWDNQTYMSQIGAQ